MPKLTLNQKIRLISRKAAAIHRREDGFSHIEDVLDAVSDLIYKQGLILTPDQYSVSAQPLPKKKTNELKEKVVIEWPDSHNGNYAWVRGRIHIYEKQAVEVMNLYAKDFNDRQDAWLVPKSNVRDMIADLELKGCTVDASAG